jgi:hypothetical protein
MKRSAIVVVCLFVTMPAFGNSVLVSWDVVKLDIDNK